MKNVRRIEKWGSKRAGTQCLGLRIDLWFPLQGGSVKHPNQNSSEPQRKPSLAAQFAELNVLIVAGLRCELVKAGLWYFRHQPGIIHLPWCVSSVRQLCSPNFCFAHRRRNMEIFKTRKITKDTSCSASFFETLCTPEWQILTPAGASLIIVCHGPLELDTFALLPACASNSKLYPTAWTSFPPRSLLHCRFSTWSSAGIRIQTRWRLFWGQNGLQQKCYRRHERTSNHLLQSHTLVSAGYQWQSKNISRYKTDASTRKPLFSKYLKKIRNAYMARAMCTNVWNSTMCGGMNFLVFVIIVPQKQNPASNLSGVKWADCHAI